MIFRVVLILFVLSLCLACLLQNIKLPSIILPEVAHHNTIGEIPFVEVMDDGDFYEADGSELSREVCIETMTSLCENNKMYFDIEKFEVSYKKRSKEEISACKIAVKDACLKTTKQYVSCDVLDKYSILFTCDLGFSN